MPTVNNVSKSDLAILNSTSGSISVSAGPSSIPVFDPNFSRIDGVNIVKTPNDNGFHKEVHNVSAANPSVLPFMEAYVGQVANGIRDHIHVFGYTADTTPLTHVSYTLNMENWFDWGDGVNKTFELHENYKSLDRLIEYRTVNRAVYLDTHSYDEHRQCRDITWYGRLGTIPLLHIDTGDDDGGTVTIANDGSANPFRIDTSGSRLFLLNTGSTGGFAINNVQPSDAVNTTRSSPAISIQGSYWNGSTSIVASTSFQHVVASTSSNYLRMIAGGVSHYYQNDGKVGHGIPGLVYLTEQIVASYGHYGMVRNDQGSTVKLIGLDTSNRVVVSGGGNGILMGAAFVSQNGSLLGATSGQRGILDVRGTAWFGSAGATHAILNGADGVFINVNANGTGTNAFTVASGRSTTSGGTTGLTVGSTGAVATPVSLSVGGGQANTGNLSATATLAFPSIAAGGQQELTVTVTGAATNDVVNIGPPSGLEAGLLPFGRVTAANTVTVRVCNFTSSPIAPASATYRVEVRKY